MTKQPDTGGAAFPEPERLGPGGVPWTLEHGYREPGMTLLDCAAMHFTAALLGRAGYYTAEEAVKLGWVCADQWLTERRRRESEEAESDA